MINMFSKYHISILSRILVDASIFILISLFYSIALNIEYRFNFIILFCLLNLILIFASGLYTTMRGNKILTKIRYFGFLFLLSFFIVANLDFIFTKNSVTDLSIIYVSCFVSVVASRYASIFVSRQLNKSSFLSTPSIITGTGEQTLVIGGAGYIGSSVSMELLKKGGRVIIFDKLKFGDYTLEKLKKYSNLTIYDEDYLDTKMLYQAMKRCNKVVHLGGLVGDPACSVNPTNTIEQNLISTKTIAELSKSLDIEKLVFASSCSVYGASKELMFENSNTNPVSLYAKTKIGSEEILKNYANSRHKIDILRFSTIFGISERIRFDLVLNLFVKMAVLDKKIKVIDGDQWRPFLHVNDAAGSVVRSLAGESKTDYCIYNIGSNANNFTIEQIADQICELIPGTDKIIESTKQDRRDYKVNFDKMKNELLFEPKWSVKEGVLQLRDYIEGVETSQRLELLNSVKYNNFLTEKNITTNTQNLDWIYKSLIEI